MTVVLTRVDQRLIHGQVIVGWLGELGAGAIGVADDEAAGDPVEREILGDSAPPGTRVDIVPVLEAAAWYGEPPSVRRLVLVRSLASLRALVGTGAGVATVNLGGLHFRPGARRYLDFLYFTREDVLVLGALARIGVTLVAQELPGRPAHVLNGELAEGLLEYDHLPSGAA